MHKKNKRARPINQQVEEVVIYIIENWKGKLTWDLLIDSIKKNISVEYTRQALYKHKSIADAYTLKKSLLTSKDGQSNSSDRRINLLNEKIHRLKLDNENLKKEINNYREMFIVWTSNAQKFGLTEKQMNSPLVKPYRGQSKSDDL